jgi:hypothetical protein
VTSPRHSTTDAPQDGASVVRARTMTSIAPTEKPARRRTRKTSAPSDMPPLPVLVIADDVPVATDLPSSPRFYITARPTLTCANCGREGSAAPGRPDWCPACGAGSEIARVRAGWR